MTRLFKCSQCDKCFPHMKNLQVHMRSHTGDKPYKCEHCDKSFSQNSHRTRHIKLVHEGKRPFACNECGQRFGEMGSLKNHMRIHTKERIACELCPKTFSHPSTLQAHVRLHVQPAPFQCPVCEQRFTQRVNMTRHRKTFHPNQHTTL